MPKLNDIITSLEGTDRLIYSDSDNPYESIYIRAKIKDGLLTVTDSECSQGPGGGWSHRTLKFDGINTQKVFMLLLERNDNPLAALKDMVNYQDRTRVFRELCNEKGIEYKNLMAF